MKTSIESIQKSVTVFLCVVLAGECVALAGGFPGVVKKPKYDPFTEGKKAVNNLQRGAQQVQQQAARAANLQPAADAARRQFEMQQRAVQEQARRQQAALANARRQAELQNAQRQAVEAARRQLQLPQARPVKPHAVLQQMLNRPHNGQSFVPPDGIAPRYASPRIPLPVGRSDSTVVPHPRTPELRFDHLLPRHDAVPLPSVGHDAPKITRDSFESLDGAVVRGGTMAFDAVAGESRRTGKTLAQGLEYVGDQADIVGQQVVGKVDQIGKSFADRIEFQSPRLPSAPAQPQLEWDNAFTESIRGARELDPLNKNSAAARELRKFNDALTPDRPTVSDESITREEALASQGYDRDKIALRDQLAAGQLEGIFLDRFLTAFDRHFQQLLDQHIQRHPLVDVETIAAKLEEEAIRRAADDLVAHYGLDHAGNLVEGASGAQASFLLARTSRTVSAAAEITDDDIDDYSLDRGAAAQIFKSAQNRDDGSWIDAGSGVNGRSAAKQASSGGSVPSTQRVAPNRDLDGDPSPATAKRKSSSVALSERGQIEAIRFKSRFASDLRRSSVRAVGTIDRRALIAQARDRQRSLAANLAQRTPAGQGPAAAGANNDGSSTINPFAASGSTAGPGRVNQGPNSKSDDTPDQPSGDAAVTFVRPLDFRRLPPADLALRAQPVTSPNRERGQLVAMNNDYIEKYGELLPDPWNGADKDGDPALVLSVPHPRQDDVRYIDRGDQAFVKFEKDADGRWRPNYDEVYWRSPLGLVPGDWPQWWDNVKRTGLPSELAEYVESKVTDKMSDVGGQKQWPNPLEATGKLVGKVAKVASAILESETTGDGDRYTREQIEVAQRREASLMSELFYQEHGRPDEHGDWTDPLRTPLVARRVQETLGAGPHMPKDSPRTDPRGELATAVTDALGLTDSTRPRTPTQPRFESAKAAHELLQRVKKLRTEELALRVERPELTPEDQLRRTHLADEIRAQREPLEMELKQSLANWRKLYDAEQAVANR